MKKILLSSLLVAGLASSAMAQGAFVGFGSDYSFGAKMKAKPSDGKLVTFKKDQFGLNLKAGYDFDIARVYASYEYDFKAKKTNSINKEIDVELGFKSHKLIFGADYTPSITDSFKLSLGAYTGVSFGNVSATIFDSEDNSVEYKRASDKGLILGAKLGGIYSLDEHNEIEFGFRADTINYGKNDKFELNKLKEKNAGFYLGYNYKF